MRSPHLLFEWPTRHRIHILLPVMLVAAAMAHTAVFFLFGVRQPVPRQDGPNPAKVYFLGPGSAAAIQLEPLLDSTDPALQAPGRGLPGDPPIEATYTPQFSKATVDFAPPPPITEWEPDARTFHGPVESPRKSPLSPPKPKPTALRASPSISNRVPTDLPAATFQTVLPEFPAPASFLIALSPDGKLLHVVADRSSGDRELDQTAIRTLRSLNFPSANTDDTQWGFVEFQWGSDLTTPPPP